MDRIRPMGIPTINQPAPRPTSLPSRALTLIALAEAAVNRTAGHLARDLSSSERFIVARAHQENLLHRATIRTAYGADTYTDRRIIALDKATRALFTPRNAR